MSVRDGSQTTLGRAALDRVLPLHLVLSAEGEILQVGPTLAKVTADAPLLGQAFFDRFELRRPTGLGSVAKILASPARTLRLRLNGPSPIVFTGLAAPLDDGCALVVLSFGIGVVDVLQKHDLTSTDFAPTDLTIEMLYLREAQTAALEEWRKLSERLAGARDAAEERAFTDTLTGLGNRRAVDALASKLVAASEPFALVLIDLDYFKEVNDSLGHVAGDAVLKVVADVLREETRRTDMVGRVGGDEFVVLMAGVAETGLARDISGRILARLDRDIPVPGGLARVSASIGITATSHYCQPDFTTMMQDADQALYRSKDGGRGQYSVGRPAGPVARTAVPGER